MGGLGSCLFPSPHTSFSPAGSLAPRPGAPSPLTGGCSLGGGLRGPGAPPAGPSPTPQHLLGWAAATALLGRSRGGLREQLPGPPRPRERAREEERFVSAGGGEAVTAGGPPGGQSTVTVTGVCALALPGAGTELPPVGAKGSCSVAWAPHVSAGPRAVLAPLSRGRRECRPGVFSPLSLCPQGAWSCVCVSSPCWGHGVRFC